MEGRPSGGSASVSLPICVGAVEVEADGPVLTVVVALPPVLQRMASFKMSLSLPVAGQETECVQDPGCEAPTTAGHKLWVRIHR